MPINIHSDDWKAVEAEVSSMLAEARRANESDGKSELQYAQFRDRIKTLEKLLALPNKKPPPLIAPLSFGTDQ